MENEWFDIAWINFTKAILHGQLVNGSGLEIPVERVLTDAEREVFYDLNQRHADEMKALLRAFALTDHAGSQP